MRRLFFILVLLAGCAPSRIQTQQGTIAVSWSKELTPGLESWTKTIEARIGPCIILESHGGYIDGKWSRISDDAKFCEWEILVDLVHKLHPDTPIVLLSCNTEGEVIRTPNVYYGRSLMWSYPGLSPWKHPGITSFEDFAYSGR